MVGLVVYNPNPEEWHGGIFIEVKMESTREFVLCHVCIQQLSCMRMNLTSIGSTPCEKDVCIQHPSRMQDDEVLIFVKYYCISDY